MPRGKKPVSKAKPRSGPSTISVFAARVDQATPKWLDEYEKRREALTAAFEELTRRIAEGAETKDLVQLTGQLSTVHKNLSLSEATMMRFGVIREQVAKERGVSAYMDRDNSTTTNILNFAPNMTAEQRAYAERLFLASVSGKEVEAPVLTLPVTADAVRETG